MRINKQIQKALVGLNTQNIELAKVALLTGKTVIIYSTYWGICWQVKRVVRIRQSKSYQILDYVDSTSGKVSSILLETAQIYIER